MKEKVFVNFLSVVLRNTSFKKPIFHFFCIIKEEDNSINKGEIQYS